MKVNLTFSDGDRITVETWDISEGGIGIHIPPQPTKLLTLNMLVKTQVIGLPIEGPILTMRIVQVSDTRVGLEMTAPR